MTIACFHQRYNPSYAALLGHFGVIHRGASGDLCWPRCTAAPAAERPWGTADFLPAARGFRGGATYLVHAAAIRSELWHRHTPTVFPLGRILRRISPAQFSARDVSVIAFSSRAFRRDYFGYYGYPAYYGGYFYSTADYSPRMTYYGSSYSAQNDLAQQTASQQQQDIDRLEDEVARLREQRESEPDRRHLKTETDPRSQLPPCWSSATSTRRKCRTTRLSAARSGSSASSGPRNFRFPGSTSKPLRKANEDRGVDFQVPK